MPADAHDVPVPGNLDGILSAGQKFITAMGPGYSLYAGQLAALEQRLLEGRFHLAVLGQVKRGKSTLINALLGEDVLPSSVVPLTVIPTFIRYGIQRQIRVRYNDGRPGTVLSGEPAPWLNKQLRGFVSEDENPKNVKGVLQVEISHPAAILRDVILIDTPGIGSTYRHNTQATMDFLPQCDAALFVISADPPITEVEVAFLKEIRSRIGQLFFVLNKVDYLTDTERELALGFYRTVLILDAGIDPATRIFAVSARKGLQAKESDDTLQWEESGLAEVFDHLIAFLAREKNRVLRDAIGRKALDVFHDVQLQIGLEMKALELPLAEIESRLSLFDKKIAEAKEQRIHAQDILTGDQKRVHAQLEAHIESLRDPLCKRLTDIAESAIAASPQDPEDAAQLAVGDAIPAWFERELGRITFVMDGEVASRLKDHEERADDLIESIRTAAAELFEIPYRAPQGERAYDPVRKPYWVEHDWDSSCSPLPALVISRLLPRSLRGSQARNRTKKQIDTLVMRNLENLRWETLQNIDTAFRKFGADLDTNLSLTIEATHGAIRFALARRKNCEAESAERLFQLKNAAAEIQEVIRQFEAVQKRS
ncbi:MAG: dynamin family protein [Methanoregula sp.]|uniref:dynamin family protein n=1 Tax=Methanoregula sp. TaxID=2052170 RepID=UPI003C39E0FA